MNANRPLSEPMVDKPKRPWLRYSVRTLLIAVTIFCVWLGWQGNVVWQRHRARSKLAASGAVLHTDINGLPALQLIREASFRGRLPRSRQFFGDITVFCIYFHERPTAEQLALTDYFPEAHVGCCGPDEKK